MSNAWIYYDIETMKPIGILWTKTELPAIEIDDELAIKFIKGHESFVRWTIVVDKNNNITLSKIDEHDDALPFWEIAPINDISTGCFMSIDADNVYIRIQSNTLAANTLYQTKQEHPSFLIKSYNLSDYEINDNMIIIHIEQAYMFSYFLG